MAMGVAAMFLSCKSPEIVKQDMLRNARVACDRGDGSSCFHAGTLSTGERAQRYYTRGCALKNAASCDAVAAMDGAVREGGLAEGCNAGDLLSCTRLADLYQGAKAKGLREQVCRMSVVAKADTSARDLKGAADACTKLVDAGEDPLRVARLQTLAAILSTESLYRYERDDAKDAAAGTGADADRKRRETDAAHKLRDELIAPKTPEARAEETASGAGPLTSIEQAFIGLPAVPPPTTQGDDAAVCKESGDPIACTLAAAAVEKNDPNSASDLHVVGCSKKPELCFGLTAYADALLRRRDSARATQLLERGCELKSPFACMKLGFEYEQGERGIASDPVKAARAYDKACELGVARACAVLAAMIDDGRGMPKNPGRVKQLRAKVDTTDKPAAKVAGPSGPELATAEEGCRKGRDANKCIDAANAMQDTDAVKAEELFRIGCTANKTTCSLWSFAIDRFRRDDASRGLRILEQGCTEGFGLACVVLGEVHHTGLRSVPRTESKAVELFQKGCELGDPNACRAHAARFRAGAGIAKNAAKADELREKAAKIDEESVKADPGDRWARAAAEQRSRGPARQELGKARDELNALAERVRSRLKTPGQPKLILGKEDADASVAREAAMRKTGSVLFSAKR